MMAVITHTLTLTLILTSTGRALAGAAVTFAGGSSNYLP
jgi:hypothetical protein